MKRGEVSSANLPTPAGCSRHDRAFDDANAIHFALGLER